MQHGGRDLGRRFRLWVAAYGNGANSASAIVDHGDAVALRFGDRCWIEPGRPAIRDVAITTVETRQRFTRGLAHMADLPHFAGAQGCERYVVRDRSGIAYGRAADVNPVMGGRVWIVRWRQGKSRPQQRQIDDANHLSAFAD